MYYRIFDAAIVYKKEHEFDHYGSNQSECGRNRVE